MGFDWNDLDKDANCRKRFPPLPAPGSRPVFRDGGPSLRAAHALYPLAAAVQTLGTPDAYAGSNAWRRLSHGGSDDLFECLYHKAPPDWNGPCCDAVFGLAPSPEQEAAAAAQGVAFERTPLARDAFVFFVSAANPATNLTTRQIRDIYSGRATSWRDLGIPFDAPLVAYQRNKNSGSQTTLERIMEGNPLAAAPTERRSDGMGGIFTKVADYRNQPGAIGFSFRYATELVATGQTLLLSLDGVPPTPENIRSGRYPFIADAYLVTAGPRTPDTQRLAEFLASPSGRSLVEASATSPLRPPPAPLPLAEYRTFRRRQKPTPSVPDLKRRLANRARVTYKKQHVC